MFHLTRSATKQQVQSGLREEQKAHNPDHGGDQQQFQRVTEASALVLGRP